MRRIAVFPAAAVLAGSLLVSASTALATFPARNGLIVYSAATDEGQQLFTIRPNGHDRRQITHVVGDAVSPDWSPDGMRIAFQVVRDFDRDCDLGIVSADGSNLRVLDAGLTACDQWPAWMP